MYSVPAIFFRLIVYDALSHYFLYCNAENCVFQCRLYQFRKKKKKKTGLGFLFTYPSFVFHSVCLHRVICSNPKSSSAKLLPDQFPILSFALAYPCPNTKPHAFPSKEFLHCISKDLFSDGFLQFA